MALFNHTFADSRSVLYTRFIRFINLVFIKGCVDALIMIKSIDNYSKLSKRVLAGFWVKLDPPFKKGLLNIKFNHNLFNLSKNKHIIFS